MTELQSTRPVLPGEDTKSLSLREFEQRHDEVKAQFTRELAHERELRETINAKLEEALKLNATEIFRRLEELNHAHTTAMENWARSLPRELFDQWQKEYDKWQGEVSTTLTTIAPHAAKIGSLEGRVSDIERLVGRLQGAGILLGFMGLAGVLALVLGLMRLARGTP